MLRCSVLQNSHIVLCAYQKPQILYGLQRLRAKSTMATANGAIGAVNPKTDKTLRLENVSMEVN